ncbi:hypothetical protein BD413DRAFT_454221, partial [Trametes elegans]
VQTSASPPSLTAEARRDEPTSIPLEIAASDCLLNIECCQSVLTLPVLPASFTTLLPIAPPIPVPTLGPLAGIECSRISDLDIIGNQCLQGGTPLCCQ